MTILNLASANLQHVIPGSALAVSPGMTADRRAALCRKRLRGIVGTAGSSVSRRAVCTGQSAFPQRQCFSWLLGEACEPWGEPRPCVPLRQPEREERVPAPQMKRGGGPQVERKAALPARLPAVPWGEPEPGKFWVPWRANSGSQEPWLAPGRSQLSGLWCRGTRPSQIEHCRRPRAA